MTKEQLASRRQQLIAELAKLGQAPIGTPEGKRREEVVADLRNTNAAIKQLNIDEALRLKSEADRKRALGVAEHVANLQRAGAPPDALLSAPVAAPAAAAPKIAERTPGEFVLWSAKKLRKTLRQFKHPLPHTAKFLPLLETFIVRQKAHVEEEAKARDAASQPSDWQETWSGAQP